MEQYRGYKLLIIDGEFYLQDTLQLARDFLWDEMPCGYCGLLNTIEGYDGCIKRVANATNACCGHGITNDAYIQFSDGSCIRGDEAIKMFVTSTKQY